MDKYYKAILVNAIAADVAYKVEHTGDNFDEPCMQWIDFDHQGFFNYLKNWYGENIATIVYNSFENFDLESAILELCNEGWI